MAKKKKGKQKKEPEERNPVAEALYKAVAGEIKEDDFDGADQAAKRQAFQDAVRKECDPPAEQLEERIRGIRAELDQQQMERNQMQVDRDTVAGFYEVTQREMREYELAIKAKEREMELLEENHRVEVKVYEQKMKHLEYEHRNTLAAIERGNDGRLGAERDWHGAKEEELRGNKDALREALEGALEANEREIAQRQQQMERATARRRRDLADKIEKLRRQYEERLSALREELELRRRVEVHEVEERKNQHINDLVENHERDFRKVRDFYNGITKANLRTIGKLKGKIKELQDRQVANQALMIDISRENRALAGPLTMATEEVQGLRADLKDASKDRLALRNAKARVTALESQLGSLRREHSTLERDYASVERERGQLFDSFEDAVRAVQRRAEYRNEVLERRLDECQVRFEARSAQLQAVLERAELDPAVLGLIGREVDDMLDSRNDMVRELQFAVARATKMHNDAIRVLEAHCEQHDIDTSDLTAAAIPTGTAIGPAGLVAEPAVP